MCLPTIVGILRLRTHLDLKFLYSTCTRPKHFDEKNMSVIRFKSELLNRTGRSLLPASLPIEALISFARDVALLTDGALGCDEVSELTEFMAAYVRKLLSAQADERRQQFERNSNHLLPLLANELNTLVRDELVSRLIGYPTFPVNLKELFDEHFVNEPEVNLQPPHTVE